MGGTQFTLLCQEKFHLKTRRQYDLDIFEVQYHLTS